MPKRNVEQQILHLDENCVEVAGPNNYRIYLPIIYREFHIFLPFSILD